MFCSNFFLLCSYFSLREYGDGDMLDESQMLINLLTYNQTMNEPTYGVILPKENDLML